MSPQQETGVGDQSCDRHGDTSPSGSTEEEDTREADGRRGMTRGEAIEIGLPDQPPTVMMWAIPSLRGLCTGPRPSGREP